MTLTAYVAQLLGLHVALSDVLMIAREQAMRYRGPKFVDSPPFLSSRSCLCPHQLDCLLTGEVRKIEQLGFLLGQFAVTESKRVMEHPAGIGRAQS
jgi:hypothetical protein